MYWLSIIVLVYLFYYYTQVIGNVKMVKHAIRRLWRGRELILIGDELFNYLLGGSIKPTSTHKSNIKLTFWCDIFVPLIYKLLG